MIDAYSHAVPLRYVEAMRAMGVQEHPFIPHHLADLEERRAFLAQFPGLKNVAVPMEIFVCYHGEPEMLCKLARLYNEGMAEMAAQNPDIFAAAVGIVPLHDTESAVREAEYAITQLGLKGILMPCSYFGKEPAAPEFRPLLRKMAELDYPIWLHPNPAISGRTMAPDSGGWEMLAETADAMLHLACCGIFEECPNLKIVTHHGGAYIPQFHTRLKSQYFYDVGDVSLKYDPNFVEPDRTEQLRNYENLKKFYVDTAFYNDCAPQIRLALEFFGEDHVLFGTDFPLPTDAEVAPNIASIRALGLENAVEEKVFHGNLERILKL